MINSNKLKTRMSEMRITQKVHAVCYTYARTAQFCAVNVPI